MSRSPDRERPDVRENTPEKARRHPENAWSALRPERSAPPHTRTLTRTGSLLNGRDRAVRAPIRWSPSSRLTLPRSRERHPVSLSSRKVRLRGSEVEVLATVGAFRVVCERDLASTGSASPLAQDLRSLREQGLLASHTVVINGSSEQVLALTKDGLELLERHRSDNREDEEDRQEFYAGFVKPRELAYDAQLYRLFEKEREELESEGATVTHVALDFELKCDYHQYVEEGIKEGADRDDARRELAEEHDLPFRSERIELPDLRIEYEIPDGQRAYRDLELATESYSRTSSPANTPRPSTSTAPPAPAVPVRAPAGAHLQILTTSSGSDDLPWCTQPRLASRNLLDELPPLLASLTRTFKQQATATPSRSIVAPFGCHC